MVSKAYTLSVVFCGNSKHCMRLILHGLLANLSAGRAGLVVLKKVGWVKKYMLYFPWFVGLKPRPPINS